MNAARTKPDRIIRDARAVQDALEGQGRPDMAEPIQRLIASRQYSLATNRSLTRDFRALRSLLIRAGYAMSRREPDGIPEADWDQLLVDIRTALATPFPGAEAKP
jgi:hypothetical protein